MPQQPDIAHFLRYGLEQMTSLVKAVNRLADATEACKNLQEQNLAIWKERAEEEKQYLAKRMADDKAYVELIKDLHEVEKKVFHATETATALTEAAKIETDAIETSK